MSNLPRLALLGCGYWGKNLARNFHKLGVLACICDPSEAGRASAKEIAPEVSTIDRLGSVFSDASIDAVVLATPATTHYELSVAALRAGKDVFVEKPMALRSAEANKLHYIAEENNCVLMVGHLMEYHPAIQKLSEMETAGEFGELRYIISNRLNFGIVRTAENAWWSLAPHDVSVVLRLMGEVPKSITCSEGSFVTQGVGDLAAATLQFDHDRLAHITVSWLHPVKERKLFVIGSKRSAIFDDISNTLTLFDQRVIVQNGVPELDNEGVRPIHLPVEEPLLLECRHFLQCVQTRTTPLTDGLSGAAVVRVLEMGQQSLEQGGRMIQINEH